MLLQDDRQGLAIGQLNAVLVLIAALELLEVVERFDRQGEVAEDAFDVIHGYLLQNEKSRARRTEAATNGRQKCFFLPMGRVNPPMRPFVDEEGMAWALYGAS